MVEQQPWDNETAACYIHGLAAADGLSLTKTKHVKERMVERGLIDWDMLFVLKYGIVAGVPEQSTRPDLFKYKIQSEAPNGEGDIIRAVVIPCLEKVHISVITIMWVGEHSVNGAKREKRENL